MKEMIIGVDVDLTVVDTLTEWLNWYEQETGHEIKSFEGLSWNIDRLMVNHKDPMSFWKQVDLYDGLKPLKNSVEVLEKLSQNHQVVFVSQCEPEHEFSKRKFLDKYFPFSSGFVSTGDKHFVRCDIFIDDSGKMLKKFPETVKTIMFKNILNENQLHERMDWEEIYNYFKNLKGI